MTKPKTIQMPNEQLKVGDFVNVLGIKRIVSIVPYNGPLKDIIFALAETVPGCGFSLEINGTTEVVVYTDDLKECRDNNRSMKALHDWLIVQMRHALKDVQTNETSEEFKSMCKIEYSTYARVLEQVQTFLDEENDRVKK